MSQRMAVLFLNANKKHHFFYKPLSFHPFRRRPSEILKNGTYLSRLWKRNSHLFLDKGIAIFNDINGNMQMNKACDIITFEAIKYARSTTIELFRLHYDRGNVIEPWNVEWKRQTIPNKMPNCSLWFFCCCNIDKIIDNTIMVASHK